MSTFEPMEHRQLSEATARRVARDYPGVDWLDIYQELWVWMLGNQRHLGNYNAQGIKHLMYRTAHIAARKERAEQIGACVQYNYRPSDIRAMLETALDGDRESWVKTPIPADATSVDNPAMDQVDAVLDIRTAANRLPLNDVLALTDRYINGIIPAGGSAERRRLDRAIERLTDIVNSYGPADELSILGHPGARRATSNAHARARVSEEY